jgi:hypothetical protein
VLLVATVVSSLRLAGWALLFSLMRIEGPYPQSKQKNQDDFELADRSNKKSSLLHLAKAIVL